MIKIHPRVSSVYKLLKRYQIITEEHYNEMVVDIHNNESQTLMIDDTNKVMVIVDCNITEFLKCNTDVIVIGMYDLVTLYEDTKLV